MPFCSLVALAVFGVGGSPWQVVGTFLILYNVVHIGVRLWGRSTGWKHGLRVAQALGNPILRKGPPHVARLAAFAAAIGLPLALGRVMRPVRAYTQRRRLAAILR